MRTINLETWPRLKQFNFFDGWINPYFSMCANVDLTTCYSVVKQNGYPITAAIVYIIARAANKIPEFRYRIRGEKVVEHEVLHPAVTILTGEDLFSFCEIDYTEDFSTFATRAVEQIEYVQEHPTLENDPARDDMLYMTAIPWVSFTSFMHPMNLRDNDSVPRFAWGKFFEQGKLIKMPLEVQVHHALMDGIHMGRFYEKVQGYLQQPVFM